MYAEKLAAMRKNNELCDVLLLAQPESAAGEAANEAAAAGGEPSGAAGGEPSGAAGGEPSGAAGGEPSGAAGGEPSGAAGGEPSGAAGGEPSGAAGGRRGTRAHRAVLAAASPYFLAMFTSLCESTKREITIKGVEEAALHAIVAYIYSPASLSVSADNAEALLSAASLLAVDGVRDAVCEFLERTLAADNALGIHAFAERHACAALAAAAASFIDTHFELVLEADELLALAPDALGAVLDGLAAPAEERVLDAVLRWTQHRAQGVEEAALHAIVAYIYSPASLSVSADNAEALLSAASLLAVDGVRDAVCEFLERTLAADNALGIHAFAERHACAALAAAAASFIDTHFELVLEADELLALAPDALGAVLDGLAAPAEERVLDAVLRWTQHRAQGVEEAALHAIVAYIYSPASLSVSADNAEALLSAASLLAVDGVRDAVCEFLERTLAADNALGIHAFAERHACAALAAAAASFIDTHFELVLEADELLALAPDALGAVLDGLAAPAEERVLDAVLRWTQHRAQERQQHLFKLLSHVRLPLLPQEVLLERAHMEPLATAEQRVQRQIIDALSFQVASSSRRAESAAGSEWYRPRAAVSAPHALLVVGGNKSGTGYTSDVLSYELSSGRWQSSAALPADRCYAGVAALDGLVYVVGGIDGGLRRHSSTFVLDVSRGSWSSGPSLTTARSSLSVAALDGVLYAVGGWDSSYRSLSSAESLDPREGVWRAIGRMSSARAGVGVAALDGRLYAVGGDSGNGSLNTVERYEPSSGRWQPAESMSECRVAAAVGVVDDELYAAGGWKGSTRLQSVERSRAGSRWQPAPSMITARWEAAAASHAGRLYVAGGLGRGQSLSSVEVFSPSTGASSELPALPAGLAGAAAVVVPWPSPAP